MLNSLGDCLGCALPYGNVVACCKAPGRLESRVHTGGNVRSKGRETERGKTYKTKPHMTFVPKFISKVCEGDSKILLFGDEQPGQT